MARYRRETEPLLLGDLVAGSVWERTLIPETPPMSAVLDAQPSDRAALVMHALRVAADLALDDDTIEDVTDHAALLLTWMRGDLT
jgi:hypothetical protein